MSMRSKGSLRLPGIRPALDRMAGKKVEPFVIDVAGEIGSQAGRAREFAEANLRGDFPRGCCAHDNGIPGVSDGPSGFTVLTPKLRVFLMAAARTTPAQPAICP
jgi:hypothetical protein